MERTSGVLGRTMLLFYSGIAPSLHITRIPALPTLFFDRSPLQRYVVVCGGTRPLRVPSRYMRFLTGSSCVHGGSASVPMQDTSSAIAWWQAPCWTGSSTVSTPVSGHILRRVESSLDPAGLMSCEILPQMHVNESILQLNLPIAIYRVIHNINPISLALLSEESISTMSLKSLNWFDFFVVSSIIASPQATTPSDTFQ